MKSFNPLDRGNLNQIAEMNKYLCYLTEKFQSPRSGKFESNCVSSVLLLIIHSKCFNPLDRGNLNQIIYSKQIEIFISRFNPLDRGNLNQISSGLTSNQVIDMFQSPRSGKFESNSI